MKSKEVELEKRDCHTFLCLLIGIVLKVTQLLNVFKSQTTMAILEHTITEAVNLDVQCRMYKATECKVRT